MPSDGGVRVAAQTFGAQNGASVLWTVNQNAQSMMFAITQRPNGNPFDQFLTTPQEVAQEIEGYKIGGRGLDVTKTVKAIGDTVVVEFKFTNSSGTKFPQEVLDAFGTRFLNKIYSENLIPPSALEEVGKHLKDNNLLQNKPPVDKPVAATPEKPVTSTPDKPIVARTEPAPFEKVIIDGTEHLPKDVSQAYRNSFKEALGHMRLKTTAALSILMAAPKAVEAGIREGRNAPDGEGVETGVKAAGRKYISEVMPWLNEPDACKKAGQEVGYLTGGLSALATGAAVTSAAAATFVPSGGASAGVGIIKGPIAVAAAAGAGYEVGVLATEGLCNVVRGTTQEVVAAQDRVNARRVAEAQMLPTPATPVVQQEAPKGKGRNS